MTDPRRIQRSRLETDIDPDLSRIQDIVGQAGIA